MPTSQPTMRLVITIFIMHCSLTNERFVWATLRYVANANGWGFNAVLCKQLHHELHTHTHSALSDPYQWPTNSGETCNRLIRQIDFDPTSLNESKAGLPGQNWKKIRKYLPRNVNVFIVFRPQNGWIYIFI